MLRARLLYVGCRCGSLGASLRWKLAAPRFEARCEYRPHGNRALAWRLPWLKLPLTGAVRWRSWEAPAPAPAPAPGVPRRSGADAWGGARGNDPASSPEAGLGGSLDESWRAAPSVCATVLPGRRKDAALFSNRDKPVPRPSLPTLLACDGGRLSVLWRPLPGEASLRWLGAVTIA